jgi:HPt (histidine-containing phosphotransfer) domain-containing protein
MTAHALPDDLKRFVAAGMNASVVKPLSMDGLAKVLAAAGDANFILPERAAEKARALDDQVLSELIETIGAEQARTSIASFIRDTDAQLPTVARSPSGTDFKHCAAAVHALAGVAALFGAGTLSAALRDAETACRHGDAEALDAAMGRAVDAWQATRPVFDQIRRDMPSGDRTEPVKAAATARVPEGKNA